MWLLENYWCLMVVNESNYRMCAKVKSMWGFYCWNSWLKIAFYSFFFCAKIFFNKLYVFLVLFWAFKEFQILYLNCLFISFIYCSLTKNATGKTFFIIFASRFIFNILIFRCKKRKVYSRLFTLNYQTI